MKVSSKEHKDSRLERIHKAILREMSHTEVPASEAALNAANAALDAYPDPPTEKDKDTKKPIPQDNDSVVLCMLRIEAELLANALDTLPEEHKRTKALAAALREQKVVK